MRSRPPSKKAIEAQAYGLQSSGRSPLNSRVAKMDRDGNGLKSWESAGPARVSSAQHRGRRRRMVTGSRVAGRRTKGKRRLTPL